MPSEKTDIIRFLKLAENIPVIDVRSPLEFEAGHIPGAFNIPLFDNAERAIVGTKYQKEGRIPAIIEGLKLSGTSMYYKLEQALQKADKGKLLVHCWRGGMRSEAMAWLFSLGGVETKVLEGGYRAYRHHVLSTLSGKRKIIILGGMTGSGKTQILSILKNRGQQVIDLEGLANHKGSAFGSLGQLPQPSTEQFVNDLFTRWHNLQDPHVWIEDESRNIGTVFLPESFYLNMQEAVTIVLIMDIKTRLPRLMEEYSNYPADLLKTSVNKISKRLGGDRTKDAIAAIDSGNIAKAIEISLHYYDKAYQFSLKKKNPKNMIFVDTGTDDIGVNATKVLEAAGMKI
jgi:tRNA 2-selenouridine synthase